jgi:hypothetical protein
MARSLCRAAELVPQRWCAGAVRRRHSAIDARVGIGLAMRKGISQP